MVQCEMCGKDVASPNRVKIEGAELDVCDECTDFGTEVQTEDSSSTSTKYSTSSSGSSGSSGGTSGGSSSSSSGGGRRRDMFDEMDELAQDYGDRIRQGRESQGLSQEELANKINEKASRIRKLERGDVLPSDEEQRELEHALGVDLSAGAASDEDAEWEGGSSSGEYTLGDVVKRKD
ncbi:MAG: multiprotein bridging factor aMBF1 [Haloarculaceae archaeon]